MSLDSVHNLVNQFRDYNENSKNLTNYLIIIGFFYVKYLYLRFWLYLFKFVRLYVLSQYLWRADYVRRYGKWALVANSTDAIGHEVAKELVCRGHSVVLVSNEQIELEEQKLELERIISECKQANTEQLVYTIYFDGYDFSELQQKLDVNKQDVAILVNNPGLDYEHTCDMFDKQTYAAMDMQVQTQCLNVAKLTKLVLSNFLDKKKKEKKQTTNDEKHDQSRCLIVNVSSQTGNKLAIKLYSNLLSPCKSFMEQFTRQLQLEYSKHDHIDVISSPCGRLSSHSRWLASPQAYAKCLVNAISTRMGTIAGHPANELQILVAKIANQLYLGTFYRKFCNKNSIKMTKHHTETEPQQTTSLSVSLKIE